MKFIHIQIHILVCRLFKENLFTLEARASKFLYFIKTKMKKKQI